MTLDEVVQELLDLKERVFALEHPHHCRLCERDFSSSEALAQHEHATHGEHA